MFIIVLDGITKASFGKSGCRRIVVGEFVAVDPSGFACMVAAIEKQVNMRAVKILEQIGFWLFFYFIVTWSVYLILAA